MNAPSLCSGSVSARLPLVIAMAAERRGIGREGLLWSAGIDPDSLLEEDAKIPAASERILWREAVERTGDSLIGLGATLTTPPGILGIFEFLCMSANTYRETIGVASRYMPLLHEDVSLHLEETTDLAKLVFRLTASSYLTERAASEYYLGGLMTMAQSCAGRLPPVVHVSFPHEAPEERGHREALARRFGTDAIEFGAAELSLAFDREALAWRLPAAASSLHRVLRSHAELMLGASRGQSGFVLRVRKHLFDELEGGCATLACVSGRMGLGPHLLQRRLAAQGTSFGEVLEGLRRDLALLYLKERTLGLSEIAFRLGYSSVQSFHRAFHAWTGEAPGRWRRDRG